MNKIKTTITWIILIILIILLLGLNYIKFFGGANPNVEQKPIENSTSTAIQTALTNITNNFNNNKKIQELETEDIRVSATQKNHSIFITYSTEQETTTYEFIYNNLKISINITNEEQNLEKFTTIYKIMISACQERLENDENIDQKIDNVLNGIEEWDGLIIQENETEKIINYTLDITKKIEVSNTETNTNDNNIEN